MSSLHSRQTPHSGYHWRGNRDRFFEGWYYRVTLPESGKSFAFMHSIQDPAGNSPDSGGAIQVLGVDDEYLCCSFPNVSQFWASYNRLAFLHWHQNLQPQLLSPSAFFEHISSGYQVTERWHQGAIPGCSWLYNIEPVYGWGNINEPQQATGGWSSFLPIFEPGWQVLMASGKATGWIDWKGTKYEFDSAPAYAEKNWGGSFPSKWFWINSNSFADNQDVAVTAVGAYRQVLWWQQCVGMIGLHFQGQFYQLSSLKDRFQWQVTPWGSWEMQAQSDRYTLNLKGYTHQIGNYVRVPTHKGLEFLCRDTTCGNLELEMRDRFSHRVLLKTKTDLAGLEVGGAPWSETWNYQTP